MMKFKLLTALALLAIVPASQAAVVVFTSQNIPIPTTFTGVFVNLENATTSFAPVGGAHLNLFFGGAGISNDASGALTPNFQFVRVGTGNTDALRNSPTGTVIDSSTGSFSTGFGSSGSPNTHLGASAPAFTAGVKGYFGFKFDVPVSGSNPSGIAYGFAEVTLTANGAGVLHGWSYEDTGAPITIPEPSAGLLGVLALSLFSLRRRRK